MTGTPLYLPTALPQWGIFAGIVLIIIGYVDKKRIWTLFGWIVLIATGLTALYFNLFSDINVLSDKNEPILAATRLKATGWQTAAGGVLAVFSLIMFQLKKKRYALLAILTIIYFILIYFLYAQVAVNPEIKIKTELKQ